MFEWWTKLDPVTQWFYGAAVFFSVFFVWQFIAALVGLGGGEDVEVDAGADVDVGADMDVDADVGEIEAASAGDAAESVSAFRLLSVRSILAFATMFFWAGALYMQLGTQTTWAVIYGTFWGLGGFAAVAIVVNVMRRLTETGTPRLATALGRPGTVYLDIPAAGEGEVRVVVSGAISYVKARAAGGGGLKAGTPIRVVRKVGPNIIEVEPIQEAEPERGEEK